MRRQRNRNLENTSSDRQKRKYRGTIQGDSIWYFVVHNTISLIMFFMLTIRFNIYGEKESSIAFMLTFPFFNMVFIVFAISIISGLLARVIAYLSLKIWFRFARKRTIRKFGDLNSGINKISFAFLISSLITSIIYSLGIIIILQQAIFNTDTLMTLIITYIIVKMGIFFSVKLFTEMKM